MFSVKIEKMEWDSAFWGIDFYNVINKEVTIDKLIYLTEIPNDRPYIIQALLYDSEIEQINNLEALGFRFVENRVTLSKKIEINENSDRLNLPFVIKNVRLEDIENRKDEFQALFGENSRHALLGKEKNNDYYYTWVKNGINGTFDDACIGAYENDSLAGFCAYRIREKQLIMGIMGVFNEFQRRYVSQFILSKICDIAHENECKEILSPTQGRNIKTINAHIKLGFLVKEIESCYYLTNKLKA